MSTVSLLEVDPDLGTWLSTEQQQLARGLRVPTARLAPGSPDLDRVLEGSGAFAVLLTAGMAMHRMEVADRPILRLLGPGDIVVHSRAFRSEILGHSTKRVAERVQIAFLGQELLAAARRFPALIVGLHLRLGDQHQRLAIQLGICQLPRVQDRVLALMWLLAESWGRVTPSGTWLPVKLTHRAIGEMVGARRPTVSLAVRDLVEDGSLLTRADGWLLLGKLAAATASAPADGGLGVVEDQLPEIPA
jgi:CRP/FNR family transcriptional regulator, cyclic AMP receptor protein